MIYKNYIFIKKLGGLKSTLVFFCLLLLSLLDVFNFAIIIITIIIIIIVIIIIVIIFVTTSLVFV